jgi:predicted Zn-dependent protease
MTIYTALAAVWLHIAESRGDHAALSKALEATRTVMSRGVPTTDDLLLHGRALLLAGRTEQALSFLREVTTRLPVDPIAFERLATAAERGGHLAEARDAYIRYAALLDNDRERWRVATRTAELSRRLREPGVAADWFERALAAAPQDTSLLVRLADAQAQAGRLDAARETMARAVAAGVDSASLRQVAQKLPR